ncbi:MAG: TonB-dependent receptor, partial [Bacteroidota bacterium]
MMRKYLLTAFLLLLAAPMVFAQNGRIRGKVLDAVTKQPISFANVRASKGGQLKGGAVADFDGNYDINPVTPGEYEVEASYVGYKPTRQTGVKVYAEATQFLDFALTEAVAVGPEVIVVAFKEKLIDPGAKGDRHVKTAGRPSRDLNSLIALEGGVTQSDDGAGISIRGNDPANNAYYVNGVRQFGNATLPPVESVEDLTVITGGIPAQYGDGLGGVISVTTKSAARKLSGSFQMESSRPFDEYNYDLVAGTISGPILKSNRANPDKPDEKMTLILKANTCVFLY